MPIITVRISQKDLDTLIHHDESTTLNLQGKVLIAVEEVISINKDMSTYVKEKEITEKIKAIFS